MAWFDLPEAELVRYRTSTQEPADLDAFWAKHIAAARAAELPTILTRYRADAYGATPVWDVEFSGADGDRIKAWYIRPAGVADDEPLPVMVGFIGYGGGRGVPVEHMVVPAAGFAYLVMDTRGQGGNWTIGATPDYAGSAGPQYPGVMTRGIADPDSYYYTRVFVDAVRAIDVACELPGVDPTRVGVRGGSQGGGIAIAAAALTERELRVCQPDVPFLCDIQRAVTITDAFPYGEIAKFLAVHVDLVPTALNTLRYIDGALLASRIRARCLFSVGLMDEICPPSTVFAAYNAVEAAKEIAVYQFGVHALANMHQERQLRHLQDYLAPLEANTQ